MDRELEAYEQYCYEEELAMEDAIQHEASELAKAEADEQAIWEQLMEDEWRYGSSSNT